MSGLPVSRGGADLDPDVRRFIELTGADYARFTPAGPVTLAARRAVAEKVREPWRAGGPQMGRTEDLTAPTPHRAVRVRLHDPAPGVSKPVLVYVHGGGWTIFSLDTHDRLMREYAARAGVAVLGVDYALSPEVKFPVALEQIVAVVRWATAGGAGDGLDAGRLAIGGDSVGANMSVAASLALRDAGDAGTIKAMLLAYGAFDDRLQHDDVLRYGGDGYMLTSGEMDDFWSNYLRGPADRENPLAVVARGAFAGLPPAFLTIPECDVLTGQSLALADDLAASGVEVRAEIYKGASHSFLEAVSISPLAGRALQDASDWLRAKLA